MESDITPPRGERQWQEFSEWQKVAKLDLTIPIGITNNITGEFKTGGLYKTSERENGQDRITARIAENPTLSNSLAEEWMREHAWILQGRHYFQTLRILSMVMVEVQTI